MNAEVWFGNLNWAMQRRVAQVMAEGPEGDLAQILEYFPPPFRQARQWVFPIKGEVDPLTPQEVREHGADIRRFLRTGPVLKREGREVWTDIKLKAAGR